MRTTSRGLAFLTIFISLLYSEAFAQTTSWLNTSDGDFHNSANWDFGVPDSGTDAIFGLANGLTINFSNDASAKDFTKNGTTVTLTLSGSSNFDVENLNLDNGVLILSDGLNASAVSNGTFTGNVDINHILGSGSFIPELIVTGSDTRLHADTAIYVGTTSALPGRLNVMDGASVEANNFMNLHSGGVSISESATVQTAKVIAGASSGSIDVTIADTGTTLSTVNNIDLGNSSQSQFTLTVEDNALVDVGGDMRVSLGDDCEGSVSVTNGGSVEVNSEMELARSDNSIAELFVEGAGSRVWIKNADEPNFYPPLTLGDDDSTGIATVNVTNGGQLIVGSTLPSLTGSIVSVESDIEIYQGSSLTGDFDAYIGNGEVSITGIGSQIATSGSLYISDLRGLSIEEGASVAANEVHLGFDAWGGATVDGVGSQLDVVGALNVGLFAISDLSILNGGAVTAQNVSIGVEQSFRSSSILVDGVGSHLNSQDSLQIGDLGDGELSVKNGAEVDIFGLATINETSCMKLDSDAIASAAAWVNVGKIEINDGATLNGEVILAPTGSIVSQSGSSTCNGSLTANGGSIEVEQGATLDLTGFQGNCEATGSGAIRIRGLFELGSEPELFQFSGILRTGLLSNFKFRIGGNSITQHDRLSVGSFDTGFFDFGQFEVELVDGFTLSEGQQFQIVTTANLPFAHWNGLSEGDLVGNYGGTDLFITFEAGDGNDIALYTEGTRIVTPRAIQITRGEYASGEPDNLSTSDNLDFSIRRSTVDVQSRTEFVIESVSPLDSPNVFEFQLEGAVFARTLVNQTVFMYNYQVDDWEDVGTSAANRIIDRVENITMNGDLSRFVEPGTRKIRARILYQSLSRRQNFTSNTDATRWRIGL